MEQPFSVDALLPAEIAEKAEIRAAATGPLRPGINGFPLEYMLDYPIFQILSIPAHSGIIAPVY